MRSDEGRLLSAPLPHLAVSKRWVTAFVVLGLAVYAVCLWSWYRPDFVQNWRESDTQTIARHFAEPGSSIFYPRIDWGGTGPGYVETEFQIYTWLVSRLLVVFGDVEWPGQLISMLSVVLATGFMFTWLRRRYGDVPAVIGLLAMLASRCVVQCATTIQPEGLCLLLSTCAWLSFIDYVDTGHRRALVVYALSGATAMLAKPTAAQLGISAGILLLVQAPRLLRKKDVWLAWGFMVGVLVLHLMHARNIYLTYGNTFGVLSGGDSKVPRLEHLLVPSLLVRATINFIMWGPGAVGAAAAILVILRRPKGWAAVFAMFVANMIWTLLALRYTSKQGGNHYHLLGALLVAHAVAVLISTLPEERWRSWAQALIVCAFALAMAKAINLRGRNRHNVWDESAVAAAEALGRHSHQGDLIVARSVAPRYDTYWKTQSNFEDPRIFYQTRTHGWPMGSDSVEPGTLEQALGAGARFYVEPEKRAPIPSLDGWLSKHATLIETTPFGGKVFDLSTNTASGASASTHDHPQAQLRARQAFPLADVTTGP